MGGGTSVPPPFALHGTSRSNKVSNPILATPID